MDALAISLIMSVPLVVAFTLIFFHRRRELQEQRADEIARLKHQISKLTDESAVLEHALKTAVGDKLTLENSNTYAIERQRELHRTIAQLQAERDRARVDATVYAAELATLRTPKVGATTIILDSIQGLKSTPPAPSRGYWDHLSADD